MARNVRGSYEIINYKSPATRQPLWRLTGTSLLGERIREQGFETREAAQVRKDILVKKDSDTNALTPKVLTSNVLDSPGLLGSVETGLLLLKDAGFPILVPALKEGRPDDYVVLLALKYALNHGFNPVLPQKCLADLDPLFRAELERRSKLPRGDRHRIKMRTLRNYLRTQNRIMKSWPKELELTALATPSVQERWISSVKPTRHMAIHYRVNVGLMLKLAKELGWISTFSCYEPPRHVPVPPKIMNLTMCQLWLDGFWETNRAAWAIILLYGGVRPSEFHAEGVHLNEDFSIFSIPVEADTKTGWRDVQLPPVAQVLLRQLHLEGRLVLKVSDNDSSESTARGKIGFYVGVGKKRQWACSNLGVKYRELSAEDAVALFDKCFPPKPALGVWVSDYPRHTCASFHATSCGDAGKTAQYLGNSKDIVEKYYWGRIKSLDECEAFYRLLPQQLKPLIDPSKIQLPKWFAIHTAAERKKEIQTAAELAEQAHAQLVAAGRETSSNLRNKKILEMRKLAADRTPEQIRDSLAKAHQVRLENQIARAEARVARLAAIKVERAKPQAPKVPRVLAGGNPNFRGNQNKSGDLVLAE